METKSKKQENLDRIRISKNILIPTNLKTNDKVNIKEKNNHLIISKKDSVSLEEKIKKYHGENLAKEFVWDKPIGREI